MGDGVRGARPTLSGNVFINVPFDARYEGLYLALITGLVGLGLTPRSVVQVPRDQHRLERILKLIRSCPYSIHDLSRVQLATTNKGVRVPRFNMPFELGLAVAVALGANSKRTHHWRVFERVPYRLTHSLTDLNGYDQYTHHGRPEYLIQELRNVFADLPTPPIDDPSRFMKMYKAVKNFRREKLPRDIFAARPFAQLVHAATSALEQERSASRRAAKGKAGSKRRRGGA